jgi:hypothetical protein
MNKLILIVMAICLTSINCSKAKPKVVDVDSKEICDGFKIVPILNKDSDNRATADLLVFSVSMNLKIEKCWEDLIKHATEEHNKKQTFMHIYYTTKSLSSYNFYGKKLPQEVIAVLYANMARATFIKDPENYNNSNKEYIIWCSYECQK